MMTQTNQSLWLEAAMKNDGPSLLRYLQRWVSLELAQDIVQESFLKLWQIGPEVTEMKRREWLFCVCRNRAFDHLRKESRMNHSSQTQDEVVADPEQNPDRQIERRQTESQLSHIMNKLTMNEKEVLRLKFQEGFSYKQISEITGHSLSHVGVLIHEGLKKIKQERASL